MTAGDEEAHLASAELSHVRERLCLNGYSGHAQERA